MDTCATRIRKAMQLRNMRQVDLSIKTGIPKSAISQYCSGSFSPKQKRLFLIAQALNVDEAWLMGLDVPMDRKTNDGPATPATIELTTAEHMLIKDFRALNTEGQQKLLEYVSDLHASGRYIKTASDHSVPKQA